MKNLALRRVRALDGTGQQISNSDEEDEKVLPFKGPISRALEDITASIGVFA